MKTLRRYVYRARHAQPRAYLALHVAGDHHLSVGLAILEATS